MHSDNGAKRAIGLSWDSLHRLTKTQPDGLRRLFKLGATGVLHASCCSFGKEVMAECCVADCPVYKPVLILTKPGAAQQILHEDANAMDAYSILIAVTDRRFVFKHRSATRCSCGPGMSSSSRRRSAMPAPPWTPRRALKGYVSDPFV